MPIFFLPTCMEEIKNKILKSELSKNICLCHLHQNLLISQKKSPQLYLNSTGKVTTFPEVQHSHLLLAAKMLYLH